VIGGVGGLFVIAALQIGDHALKTALGIGGGGLNFWKMAAELRAVGAIEEKVTLDGGVLANRQGWVKLKTVILPGIFQNLAVVGDVEINPTKDGKLGDAL